MSVKHGGPRWSAGWWHPAQPWLAQWHAEPEPPFPACPAEAIRGLLDAKLGAVSLTRWRPPAPARGRLRKA